MRKSLKNLMLWMICYYNTNQLLNLLPTNNLPIIIVTVYLRCQDLHLQDPPWRNLKVCSWLYLPREADVWGFQPCQWGQNSCFTFKLYILYLCQKVFSFHCWLWDIIWIIIYKLFDERKSDMMRRIWLEPDNPRISLYPTSKLFLCKKRIFLMTALAVPKCFMAFTCSMLTGSE